MLSERLRNLFRGQSVNEPGGILSPGSPSSSRTRLHQSQAEVISTRTSRALEQFFEYIRGQAGLSLLDLGGATQQNIDFITNLGHRITTQSFLQTLDETFGSEDISEQANPGRIEYFLEHALNFPEYNFDGVLVWDVLQYLSAPLLNATLNRLYRTLRPGSYLLAFFHASDKIADVPACNFRIQDPSTLVLAQHGTRRQAQSFNNRNLEKLFVNFESVKFFLTRESLREVIVRR